MRLYHRTAVIGYLESRRPNLHHGPVRLQPPPIRPNHNRQIRLHRNRLASLRPRHHSLRLHINLYHRSRPRYGHLLRRFQNPSDNHLPAHQNPNRRTRDTILQRPSRPSRRLLTRRSHRLRPRPRLLRSRHRRLLRSRMQGPIRLSLRRWPNAQLKHGRFQSDLPLQRRAIRSWRKQNTQLRTEWMERWRPALLVGVGDSI